MLEGGTVIAIDTANTVEIHGIYGDAIRPLGEVAPRPKAIDLRWFRVGSRILAGGDDTFELRGLAEAWERGVT
jgi:hypothetical protein